MDEIVQNKSGHKILLLGDYNLAGFTWNWQDELMVCLLINQYKKQLKKLPKSISPRYIGELPIDLKNNCPCVINSKSVIIRQIFCWIGDTIFKKPFLALNVF